MITVGIIFARALSSPESRYVHTFPHISFVVASGSLPPRVTALASVTRSLPSSRKKRSTSLSTSLLTSSTSESGSSMIGPWHRSLIARETKTIAYLSCAPIVVTGRQPVGWQHTVCSVAGSVQDSRKGPTEKWRQEHGAKIMAAAKRNGRKSSSTPWHCSNSFCCSATVQCQKKMKKK
jgi:hypothetical protein